MVLWLSLPVTYPRVSYTAYILHVTAKMPSLVIFFSPQNLDTDISKASKLRKLETSSSYIVASLIPCSIFLPYIMLVEIHLI